MNRVFECNNFKSDTILIESRDFEYILSHQMREPIVRINGLINLLVYENKNNLGEDGLKYIELIKFSSKDLSLLLDDLLEYLQIGKISDVHSIDTNQIVQRVIDDLSPTILESDVTITIETPLPIIKGDETYLYILFNNLVTNAIKFRRENFPCSISIGVKSEINFYKFMVKDNGMGIEKMYHGRIFEIFQKLHSINQYPGTGVGLAKCKKIVEFYHGKFEVESALNMGSTFNFFLPKNFIQNG